jgi:asparagine synthetase B (glutamine-hydrolysing)
MQLTQTAYRIEGSTNRRSHVIEHRLTLKQADNLGQKVLLSGQCARVWVSGYDVATSTPHSYDLTFNPYGVVIQVEHDSRDFGH